MVRFEKFKKLAYSWGCPLSIYMANTPVGVTPKTCSGRLRLNILSKVMCPKSLLLPSFLPYPNPNPKPDSNPSISPNPNPSLNPSPKRNFLPVYTNDHKFHEFKTFPHP